ncbi:MAG: HlyD family efflux transporter periplasmic adaptor subunit [Saprospiraceae bacterium]|nr:HlyD family efflux transporter periplasmic adaptor subunit [Saprospiraceae bacterium]
MAEKYQIRSEEVQEILGTPPSWIVRWGTSVALICLFVLVFLSWIFKYPEKVVSEVTLTTLRPPVSLIAQADGYIAQIMVEDGDTVKREEVLAVISNTARYDDILKLESDIQQLQGFDQEALLSYIPDKSLRLGDLHADYSAFIQLFQDFSFDKSDDYDEESTQTLNRQITALRSSISILTRQLESAKESKALAEQQYSVNQNLYDGNNETLELLQQSRDDLIDKEQEIISLEREISVKKQEIANLNMQILAIQQGSKSGNLNKFRQFQTSLNTLDSRIQSWKQKYILYAPTEGVASFYNFRTEQQYVRRGDEVMAIVPFQDGNQFLGEVMLPVTGSGKVEKGQRVIIKFDSYPFQEFGFVEGRVESKALLPQNNTYFVKVSLPNGLITSFGNELTFRQQMIGKAEIITADKRFIERALQWFSSL